MSLLPERRSKPQRKMSLLGVDFPKSDTFWKTLLHFVLKNFSTSLLARLNGEIVQFK